MANPFKPTYAKTLRKVRAALNMERVLSSSCRQRSTWPKSNKRMIFICDVLDRVGRTKFGDAWTSKEFGAYRRVYEFHNFPQTLADFRNELEAWQTDEHTPFDSPQETAATTSAQDTRNGEAIEKGADAKRPITRAEFRTQLNEASMRHVKELEEWGAKYRPQYDAAIAEWGRFAKENAAAIERLNWVIDWVVRKARDGEFETYLRLVDTVNAPGPYGSVARSRQGLPAYRRRRKLPRHRKIYLGAQADRRQRTTVPRARHQDHRLCDEGSRCMCRHADTCRSAIGSNLSAERPQQKRKSARRYSIIYRSRQRLRRLNPYRRSRSSYIRHEPMPS